MNRRIKIVFMAIFLIISVSVGGFALDLSDLQESVNGFSQTLAGSLPFNSTIGLNWSDAWVGKLIPSAPPHFGAGLTLGFTTMEFGAISALADKFDFLLPDMPFEMDRFILPAYTAEVRLGGLFMPFDVGLKFGYLPDTDFLFDAISIDYLLVGADIRYAIMEGNVILPKISLGLGLNYLRGGIGATGPDMTIDHSGGTIDISDPHINFQWHTYTLDFKAQVSKSLLIITPYAGVGASYGRSSAGYSVAADISGDLDIEDIGITISDTGMSSMIDNNDFNLRAFGGISLNLALLKIDLTGQYSFKDGNYGASLGFRIQI